MIENEEVEIWNGDCYVEVTKDMIKTFYTLYNNSSKSTKNSILEDFTKFFERYYIDDT